MKPKHRRLWMVLAALAVMATGVAAMLYAFRANMVYFYTPSELIKAASERTRAPNKIRIGGLVKQGSIVNLKNGGIQFIVTDLTADITVIYHGFIPSLFREGQGVVAEGAMHDETGVLNATLILAKHDETYMPASVVKALKASGRWQEGALPK